MKQDKATYEAGESIIKESMLKSRKIYLELDLLKYIGFSKAISYKSLTDEIYSEFIKIVTAKDFHLRDTDHPDYIFNKSKLLTDFMKKEKAVNRADNVKMMLSPPWTTENEISHFVDMIYEGMRILGDFEPITIDLNITSLSKLSEMGCNCTERVYTELFDIDKIPNSKLRLINKPMTEFTEEEILKYDTYFIYNLTDFNNTFIEQLDARKFFDKMVFTRKILPDVMLEDLECVDVAKFFITVYSVMNCACNFKFLKTPTCVMSKPNDT